MDKMSIQQQLAELHSDGLSVGTQELLAYRTMHHLFDVAPQKQIQSQRAGSYITRVKGRGMEFDESRHYQAGDDIRSIDWRVTARTGKAHTKIYREERERPVIIACDFRRTMHFGTELLFKSVQAAHIASLLGWSACERGDKVGAYIFNSSSHKELKPKSRKSAMLGLIYGLIDAHQCGDDSPSNSGNLADHLMRLRRLAKPGSSVFIISDFFDLDAQSVQHLNELKRHCEIQAFDVYDAFERRLPEASIGKELTLSDARHQTHQLFANRYSLKEYEKNRRTQINAKHKQLDTSVNAYYEISAGQTLHTQLLKTGGRQ